MSAFLVGFPVAHWRGRHALVLTLVVTVVGLHVLAARILPVVSEMRGLLTLGIWVGANSAILVWQLVGIWRATEKHLALPTDTLAAWGGYFTMLVAVILAVIQTIDGVLALSPPLPRGAAIEAATTLPVSSDGQSITISGDLNYDVNAALEAVLERREGIRRVELESEGGQVFAARAMAINIMKHGLDTHVTGKCYSACTLVFMAGRRRLIDPKARLGFHQYDIPGALRVKVLDVEAEQSKDRAYFASRGVSEDFLHHVFRDAHSKLWVPGHEVLRSGGVVTD